MKVRVPDRLAGGHSHIDAEVVAVGTVVLLDSPLNRLDKCPRRSETIARNLGHAGVER